MMNVLFRTVTSLLWENANLEAQLFMATKVAMEEGGKENPEPPPENGAGEKDRAEIPQGRWAAVPPPMALPPEVTSAIDPPPYEGGKLYPALPSGALTPPAAVHPIALVKQVTDAQGVTRTTTTYRTRTWAELQVAGHNWGVTCLVEPKDTSAGTDASPTQWRVGPPSPKEPWSRSSDSGCRRGLCGSLRGRKRHNAPTSPQPDSGSASWKPAEPTSMTTKPHEVNNGDRNRFNGPPHRVSNRDPKAKALRTRPSMGAMADNAKNTRRESHVRVPLKPLQTYEAAIVRFGGRGSATSSE